jgi:hypothetical protein
MTSTPDLASDPAFSRFFTAVDASLARGDFARAVLAKPRRTAGDLQRVTARRVVLKGEDVLSLVSTHATRDLTQNFPVAEGVTALRELLLGSFHNAHLFTETQETQLAISQKGQCTVRVNKGAHVAPAPTGHDREKQRWLELSRPFLAELGVTTAQGQLIPAMSRKWKQINKFVEVFAGALASSTRADARELKVIDFGSGKGYLTFAVHDWLRHAKGVEAHVTGVELRPDMVALCNAAIDKLHLGGLRIEQGDVRDYQPEKLDVMIALHACDTATDHAIHLGLRAGAEIIMCSPCCHKQLRPQLLSPHPLAPILQHGVHLGQQAEMLTDGLRAMLLDACGYDTQVFEFISLEHTNKNKMILAVKRAKAKSPDAVLQQVREVKDFYRIQEQCLETLLRADGLIA